MLGVMWMKPSRMADHVRRVSSVGRTPAKRRIAKGAMQSAGACCMRRAASAGV